MLAELKRELLKECANSIEPRVLLPTWKALIVDLVTVCTLGFCRWRWNGLTVDEFGDGFAKIEVICDESWRSVSAPVKFLLLPAYRGSVIQPTSQQRGSGSDRENGTCSDSCDSSSG